MPRSSYQRTRRSLMQCAIYSIAGGGAGAVAIVAGNCTWGLTPDSGDMDGDFIPQRLIVRRVYLASGADVDDVAGWVEADLAAQYAGLTPKALLSVETGMGSAIGLFMRERWADRTSLGTCRIFPQRLTPGVVEPERNDYADDPMYSRRIGMQNLPGYFARWVSPKTASELVANPRTGQPHDPSGRVSLEWDLAETVELPDVNRSGVVDIVSLTTTLRVPSAAGGGFDETLGVELGGPETSAAALMLLVAAARGAHPSPTAPGGTPWGWGPMPSPGWAA